MTARAGCTPGYSLSSYIERVFLRQLSNILASWLPGIEMRL